MEKIACEVGDGRSPRFGRLPVAEEPRFRLGGNFRGRAVEWWAGGDGLRVFL